MHSVHKGMFFIFGAFLIIFTFIMWAPAKWIIFAIGIVLVLKSFMGDKCLLEKKPMKKRK